MTLLMILIVATVLAGVWTVVTLNLLRSAIGLALVSVLVTLLLFFMNAQLAAVFELSVCAGLITVVFISTISLTRPLTGQEASDQKRRRIKRFILLPILVLLAAMLLLGVQSDGVQSWLQGVAVPPPVNIDVRETLWSLRGTDLIGQILVILAGIFGVVVLFKNIQKKKEEV